MSDDPMRLRDAPRDAPPELTRLVRSLEGPPPLPPRIRLEVRARLARRASPPAPPTRWVAPAVVAAAAVIAGLVLWVFRPTAPEPAPVIEPELALAPERSEPTEGPAEAVPRPSPQQPEPPDEAPREGSTRHPAQRAAGGGAAPGQLRVMVRGGLGEIFVDGLDRGPSPQIVELPPGDHEVEVRFAGGHVTRRRVRVLAGQIHRVAFRAPSSLAAEEAPRAREEPSPEEPRRVPAEPPPRGTLSPADVRAVVRAHRSDAQGCYRRHPPTTRDDLRLDVRITIEPSGAVSRADVGAGAPTALAACLRGEIRSWRFPPARSQTTLRYPFLLRGGAAARPAGRGRIVINTVPWARVYLDGRFVGNTPITNLEATAGRHTLVLEGPDGSRHRVTIDVRDGETMRIVRRL